MSIKLIAPAGVGGIVQGRSQTSYTVAPDGTISNVQPSDVDGLMNSGWIFAVSRFGNYTTPGAPVAASTVAIGASTTLAAGNTVSLSQPDVPRQVQAVVIAGSTLTLTAGILSLVYVANDTTTQTDTLNFGALALAGTMTLGTSKGVMHMISATVVGPVTGGSSPTFILGTNNFLAVPLDPGSVDVTFIKETKITPTNGTFGLTVPADETIGSLQISTGMITPTTVPDGTHLLSFGYSYVMPG